MLRRRSEHVWQRLAVFGGASCTVRVQLAYRLDFRAMSTRFQIPRILQPYCGGKSELLLQGDTVRDVFDQVKRQYPKLYQSLCDEQ
ncbi:MAG: hypothetical protein AAF961_11800, partial [Planctomycetota bacterium]